MKSKRLLDLLAFFAMASACNDPPSVAGSDAGADATDEAEVSSDVDGRTIVLCRGTSVAGKDLHAYLATETTIAGTVVAAGGPPATAVASQTCGYATGDLPAFQVKAADNEVWTFFVGTLPPGGEAFVPLRFLQDKQVSVLFRQTPRFGNAYGLVVRSSDGSLLLAVDESGRGAGLHASDVPELEVTQGSVYERTRTSLGIVDQSEVMFAGDVATSVRPGTRSTLNLAGRPYIVGVGNSFSFVQAFATDTADVRSWFASAGAM